MKIGRRKSKLSRGLSVLLVVSLVAASSVFAGWRYNQNSLAGGGGYPDKWANAPMDSITDTWGMLNRECTSFVAWKLSTANKYTIPWFGGNAKDWKQRAIDRGIRVDNIPSVGAVAWWAANSKGASGNGHVAWVSAVNGSTITVEEYNHLGSDDRPDGAFHVRVLDKANPDKYIHFNDGWKGVGGLISDKSGQLNKGQTLNPGHYLTSNDTKLVLVMQTDGNLVLYNGSSAIWSSKTAGNQNAYAVLQTDGNLVIYKSDRKTPLWASNTSKTDVTKLAVQDDGNLVLYGSNGASRWASNTVIKAADLRYFGSDRVLVNQLLTSGQYIRSSDRRFITVMQKDGNLVTYAAGGRAVWASGTNGNSGAKLKVQTDGNIVIYRADGRAIWSTSTPNTTVNRLVMQTDGNLVAYLSSGTAKWASNTVNKF